MKPLRLPVAANNAENTDTKGVGASPKFFSNTFTAGRHRKSSIGGEPLGCLALLDAGERGERPRALPSTGEVFPTYVKAQPTVHVHRPRAVLSSPENDELACELQGQQAAKLTDASSAAKAVLSPSEDLPHAPLSSIEDLAPLLSYQEVSRAVSSPPKDLLSMGPREIFVCGETSSNSTHSDHEHIDGPYDQTNELADIKQNRPPTLAATKKEKPNHVWHSESQFKESGNEENVSSTTEVNRTVKNHSNLTSKASHRPAKQLPKPASKGKSPRVPRPWY